MDGRTHPARLPQCLSLVIPAYNEEAGIRQAIAEADAALASLVTDYDILVVDDGSTDQTAALVAAEAAARPHVHLLRHDCNRGYGAALRTGFQAARFECVAFTDADCQFHLDDLARLLPLTDQVPVVAGFREKRQDSWRRCFLSRGYNLLVCTLLGTRVRDCDCALKVFRREALASLLPETDGFLVNAEMLARAGQLGLDVAEVGVRHRPRLHGTSKVSLGEVPRTLARLLPFWWSRVLFPGSRGETLEPVPGHLPWPALALVVVLAALLFFTRLRAPLLEPQEPRYAEIPRQMLEEGRFLVPVLHGQAYLDKPPLLYWLVMGCYRLFGVHDWSARLVPGLAGLLTVLLTYLWGRRVAGERAALCGAVVLCLSGRFVYLERILTMDSLLCLWVVAGLAAAHRALWGATLRTRWWLLAASACGLGLLTKGPVALVLIAAPIVAYQLLEPRCARITWRDWGVFVMVALLWAAPWYVAVMVVMPDFAWHFFWQHNVVRFVAPFDHAKPVWFHLPGLLLGMLPWTLLLPGLIRFLARRSVRTATRRPLALGFFLLAFLSALLFFSLAGCKRPVYILPGIPPLALALGCYLDAILPRRAGRADWIALVRYRCRLAYQATLLVLALGLGVLLVATTNQLVKPAQALVPAALALVGILALLRSRRRISWGACGAATFAVLLVGVTQLHSAYNRQFALRGHLRTHTELAHRPQLPVVCYPQRWDSVTFYLPRADVHVYTTTERDKMVEDLHARPKTLLVVKSGEVLRDLLRALPPSLEFVARSRPGLVTMGWIRVRGEVADTEKRARRVSDRSAPAADTPGSPSCYFPISSASRVRSSGWAAAPNRSRASTVTNSCTGRWRCRPAQARRLSAPGSWPSKQAVSMPSLYSSTLSPGRN
jgi:dolichol-phosphate mannosyltransferase